MASKGAITITQDDLIKMKMRANLIPNRILSSTQPIANKTRQHISIKKARSAQINGLTISKTLKKENKKKGTKSSRKKSLKGEGLMSKKGNFSKNSKNNNLLRQMLSFSKTLKRYALSTANFYIQILSKEEANK